MPIIAKSIIAARATALAAAAAAAAATPAVRPDIQPRARVRVAAAAAAVSWPAAAAPVSEGSAMPARERKPGDYDTGYKKPPKKNQFQPGQSGNKKGRPKGAKGLKTITLEVMTEKITVRTPKGTKKMSKMEAQVRKKSELALTGNLRAMESIEAKYELAVPDEVATLRGNTDVPSTPEQLDAVDQATWEALVAMLGVQPTPGTQPGEGR